MRRLNYALSLSPNDQTLVAEIGQEAEGVATARELYGVARQRRIEMPITEQVYRVLYENFSPQAAVEALLKRDPRPE